MNTAAPTTRRLASRSIAVLRDAKVVEIIPAAAFAAMDIVGYAPGTNAPCKAVRIPDAPLEDGEDPWFAEQPGFMEPRVFALVGPDGDTVRTLRVAPVAPWGYFDAMVDRLMADGWAPPECEPYVECPHGLSAALCTGPSHF